MGIFGKYRCPSNRRLCTHPAYYFYIFFPISKKNIRKIDSLERVSGNKKKEVKK
jgi:hypothetical protein